MPNDLPAWLIMAFKYTMFAVVYNLVRTVMQVASARQQVGVDRISFADALG